MQNQYSVLNLGALADPIHNDVIGFQAAPVVLHCSFCSLGEGEVARLFEGHSGYICDECVEVCTQLLEDYRELGVRPPSLKRPWYKKLLGNGQTNEDNCSFNHHDHHNPEGERLFPGTEAQICDKCVRACEVLKSGLLFGE